MEVNVSPWIEQKERVKVAQAGPPPACPELNQTSWSLFSYTTLLLVPLPSHLSSCLWPMGVHTCPCLSIQENVHLSATVHIHQCTRLYALAFWHLFKFACVRANYFFTHLIWQCVLLTRLDIIKWHFDKSVLKSSDFCHLVFLLKAEKLDLVRTLSRSSSACRSLFYTYCRKTVMNSSTPARSIVHLNHSLSPINTHSLPSVPLV